MVGRSTYALVRRVINGVPRDFLERLKQGHDLDCSVSETSPSPKTVWSGFGHLDGHAVRVLGPGGADLGVQTVTGGTVATPYPVSAVEVGLTFPWVVETMPIEARLGDGTLVGNAHRIVRSSIRFAESRGPIEVNGQVLVFTSFGLDALGTPPPVFTGVRTIRFIGWHGGVFRRGGGGTVRISGDSAARATVLSVTSEIAA